MERDWPDRKTGPTAWGRKTIHTAWSRKTNDAAWNQQTGHVAWGLHGRSGLSRQQKVRQIVRPKPDFRSAEVRFYRHRGSGRS
jgi:hypothetical protein